MTGESIVEKLNKKIELFDKMDVETMSLIMPVFHLQAFEPFWPRSKKQKSIIINVNLQTFI